MADALPTPNADPTQMDVEGDVFARVELAPINLQTVDLKSLVFNSHMKDGQFTHAPGDPVPVEWIRATAKQHGTELLQEFLRTKTLVPASEYKPDLDHQGFSVESYGHPVFRNQGHPDGDIDYLLGFDDEPELPAEDKATRGAPTVSYPKPAKTARSTDSKEPVRPDEQEEGE